MSIHVVIFKNYSRNSPNIYAYRGETVLISMHTGGETALISTHTMENCSSTKRSLVLIYANNMGKP